MRDSFSKNQQGLRMKALQVEASKGLLSLEDLPKPEVSTAIITTTHTDLSYMFLARTASPQGL